ncbi:MAG: cache domain-containing protein [Spirochaetota bacterium]
MKKYVLFFSTLIMLACFSTSYAQNRRAEAELNVNNGLDFIKDNGENTAFMEFTSKKGKFTKGEYYIFVVDFEGKVLAHGGDEKLVGKSMYNLKDSDGDFFVRKFIDLAKIKGEGWVNYKWANPVTKKIDLKSTFVKTVPGKKYFLGCGIYLGK